MAAKQQDKHSDKFPKKESHKKSFSNSKAKSKYETQGSTSFHKKKKSASYTQKGFNKPPKEGEENQDFKTKRKNTSFSTDATYDKGKKRRFNKTSSSFKRNKDDKKKDFKQGHETERRSFKDNRHTDPKDQKPINKRDRIAGKQFKTRRDFEGADLSFGKWQPKEPEVSEETAKEEVTFKKELKNKWETPVPGRQQKREFKKGNFPKRKENPDATRHRKGFKKHFDSGKNQELAYQAEGEGSIPQKGSNYFKADYSEEMMPLNKFIAHCGVCSRRDAAGVVKAGRVSVNDVLIDNPGHRVSAEDKVLLDGKEIKLEIALVYVLLNKPKGYITTMDDPKQRRTVMHFFKNDIEERIFPVGRLDRNTTGLLLLTNDGDLAQKLAHPSHEIKKIYQVELDKEVTEGDFKRIQEGLILEDGPAPVDEIAYLDDKKQIGLEIHIGRNRIVRRIFESLNYEVVHLDRVVYAGLTKKNIPRGHWRYLSKQEVINLKHLK